MMVKRMRLNISTVDTADHQEESSIELLSPSIHSYQVFIPQETFDIDSIIDSNLQSMEQWDSHPLHKTVISLQWSYSLLLLPHLYMECIYCNEWTYSNHVEEMNTHSVDAKSQRMRTFSLWIESIVSNTFGSYQ